MQGSGGVSQSAPTGGAPSAPGQAPAGSYQQPYGAYQPPAGAFYFDIFWLKFEDYIFLFIVYIAYSFFFFFAYMGEFSKYNFKEIFPIGYYGGQPQGAPVPGGVPQAGYGFPGYNYGGQQNSAPSAPSADGN